MGHYLEAAGVPTTGISLIREHTRQMRPPRFLWVPFELGRPFGAPNAPDFQRRVLREALALLERGDGPVVLADFPDDAPADAAEEAAQGWACPVVFRPDAEERPELVAATLAEIARLAPWHEHYVASRGRSAAPTGPLERERFLALLGKLAEGSRDLDVVEGVPLQEWVRLGCDDLRTWYGEAAQGQPGRGTSAELRDWFWRDTAAARLVAAAARALLEHPSPLVAGLALRAMVPRQYFAQLMPGVAPFV